MSTKQSPASRYLKARLQVLKRPAVWGSAVVLSLPLFFLANYWQHPEKFTAGVQQWLGTGRIKDETTAETAASPAVSDPSTILDIPNVPGFEEQPASSTTTPQTDLLIALLNGSSAGSEQEQAERPSRLQSRNSFSSRRLDQPEISLSEAFSPNAPLSTAQTSSTQPSFAQSTLTQPSSALPSSTTMGSGTEQARSSQSSEASASNPLQAALERILGQPAADTQTSAQTASPEAQPGAAAQVPSNPDGQTFGPSLNPASHSTPIDPTPASPSTSQPSGFQPYMPQTSPAPGTTGYTLPPAFRTPANTPGFTSTTLSPNFGVPQSSSGFRSTSQIAPAPSLSNSSFGNSGQTPGYSAPSSLSSPPQGQADPFSVPRTPPGRYIGGGEINTFSNP